jgi:hypothetical protein
VDVNVRPQSYNHNYISTTSTTRKHAGGTLSYCPSSLRVRKALIAADIAHPRTRSFAGSAIGPAGGGDVRQNSFFSLAFLALEPLQARLASETSSPPYLAFQL